MEDNNEFELDLMELFRFLKRKIWILVSAFVVCGVIGFAVSSFMISPKYIASTRMYVLNRSNESSVEVSDFQISTQMLEDYKVLITGRNVTQEVVNKLGLNMSHQQLASKISVTSPKGTRVLQVSVTDTDAQRAADIANCVQEIASEQIKEIMDVDAVKVIYEAEVPKAPSSPNVVKYAILFALLGTLLCIAAYVIVFVKDDTIRTEEDVSRYLGLSTLGTIPNSDVLVNGNSADKRNSKQPKPLKGSR